MNIKEKIAIKKELAADLKTIKEKLPIKEKIAVKKRIAANLAKLGSKTPKSKNVATPMFDSLKTAKMKFKPDRFKDDIKSVFDELEKAGKSEGESLNMVKPALVDYLKRNDEIQVISESVEDLFNTDETIEESVSPFDQMNDMQLRQKGVFFLDAGVDDKSVMPIIKQIMVLNSLPEERQPKKIKLVVCSNGGDLAAAFALIDTMKISKIPVHTVAMGKIRSCGLLIAMSGEKGNRTILPNTSVLSHQWRTPGVGGTESDINATQVEFKNLSERILVHYEKHSGNDQSLIRKELLSSNDRWLTAQETINFGLVDKLEDGSFMQSFCDDTTSEQGSIFGVQRG